MKVWISDKHLASRNGDIINAQTGYKLRPTKDRYGYMMASSRLGGSVHRILANAFLGGIPEGYVVNHLDGVKHNNCLSNLEVTTYSGNSYHAYATGLAKGKKGETNSQAELSEEQVLAMLDDFRNDLNNDDIAEKYKVHTRYVSLIRHGKRWKHLHQSGEVFPRSFKYKYTPETLLRAYDMIKQGHTNTYVSEVTGIERSAVSRIRTGKLYPEFYSRHRGCND